MQWVARCTTGLFALLLAASPGASEDGSADVFRDLFHTKRDAVTGQPILQKRQVLVGGVLDWGYCPIPIDAAGEEIPLAAQSCAVDPAESSRLVPVTGFGRLPAIRTTAPVLRAHFDAVIADIRGAERVDLAPEGRLRLGTGCTVTGCSTWKAVDSAMENLALYQRLMKYGHLQTDPGEIDTSQEPDAPHPALRAEDWAKFGAPLVALLPGAAAADCFPAAFASACAEPQSLAAADFVRAAAFLAGAADRNGAITVDVVQVLNRALRITIATPGSAATIDTLPALVRDEGVIAPAGPGLPAPADERLVDFAGAAYVRTDYFSHLVPGLKKASGAGYWVEDAALPLLEYLEFANGASSVLTGAAAFVANARDSLRAVQFVRNYATPVDLFYVPPPPPLPTTVIVGLQTAETAPITQVVTLTATVTSDVPVNEGTCVFELYTSGGSQFTQEPMLSRPVVQGVTTATFHLPPNTPLQDLTLRVWFHGTDRFEASSGTGILRIGPLVPPEISVKNHVIAEGTGLLTHSLRFEVTLSKRNTVPVTVQYSTRDHTAVAPVDYEAQSGTLTFPAPANSWDPGVRSMWVEVHLAPDATNEPDETLSLVLSSPTNASLGRAAAVGTIVDDDGSKVEPPLDVNQDGSADLVLRHGVTGALTLWYMDGVNRIVNTAADPAALPDLDWELRAVGDFNADWKPDFVWQHRTNGSLGAWLMNASARLDTVYLTTLTGTSVEPDLDWKIMAAADMDGDGEQDLIWQHQTSGALRIWHMFGTTQLDSTPIALTVGSSDWRVAGVGDMNRDGWNDLVWHHRTQGGVATWFMNDRTVLDTLWLTPAEVPDVLWQVVGVGDMNADGDADLVWQRADDGRLAVWLMDAAVRREVVALVPAAVSDPNWRVVSVR